MNPVTGRPAAISAEPWGGRRSPAGRAPKSQESFADLGRRGVKHRLQIAAQEAESTMAEGFLAALTKQPCLPRNAKVRPKRLVGPAHVQPGRDMGIGRPPIPLQLPAAVRQAAHPHVHAEPQFVPSVLPLPFAPVLGFPSWTPEGALFLCFLRLSPACPSYTATRKA